MTDQNGYLKPANGQNGYPKLATDRDGYLEFAARLAVAPDGKLDVDRLRWQGIPVKDASDILWEPIFIRSVENGISNDEFFDALTQRAEQGLTFDPFVRDYSARFRRDGRPIEAIIYRQFGSGDHGDLFEVLGVGGLVTADAVAFTARDSDREAAAEGASVALGLIDDSVPLLNARFWDGAGASRIVGFNAQSWGAPPTILGSTEIGNWLARLQDEGEDVLYRELATLFFPPLTRHSLRNRGSHGAHMLDLAGGTDQSPGDPIRDVPLRVVQLPPVVYDDTSGAKMPLQVMQALQWLISETEGTAQTLVVNISLGVLAGPKDGCSLFEQLVANEIDNAAARSLELIVVFPYGNDYAKQQVARSGLAPEEEREFTLRVQPDDLTPSYAELRASKLGPNADLGTLEIGLRSPTGDELVPQTLAPGSFQILLDAAGAEIAWVAHFPEIPIFPKPIPPYIVIALFPTKALSATQPTSPSGAWSIHARNTGTAEMDVILQVQSDDSPYPRRTGARQSYLDAPSVHGFNPITRDFDFHGPGDITNEGTNSAYTTIASAGARTVAGAVVRRDALNTPPDHISPAGYSSEGADWSGRKPTASALSGVLRSPRGVRAAGVHSHATVSLDGTSAAAATFTRDTVLRLLGEAPLPETPVTAPLPAARLGDRVILDNPAIRKRGV